MLNKHYGQNYFLLVINIYINCGLIRRRVIYAIYSVAKTLACWAHFIGLLREPNPKRKSYTHVQSLEFSGYIKPPISQSYSHTHTMKLGLSKWVLAFDFLGFIFFLQDSRDDLTGYQFWYFWSTYLMKVAAATAFGAGNLLLLSFDYSFV